MADRAFFPSQSFGANRVYLEFRFMAPGTGTSVTSVIGANAVKSIAHVQGTNIVTVTLMDRWPQVVALSVDMRDDSATGNYVTKGSITNEGGTLPITFKVAYFLAAGSVNNDAAYVTECIVAFMNGTPGIGYKL